MASKPNSSSLINQTSGKVEYYTPSYITERARAVMGCIELDPASCAAANQFVGASRFFSLEQDGLSLPWATPALWMNHPFGRTSNRAWLGKLLEEYGAGNVQQACCITYACTSEAWFQPLYKFPMCFIAPRVDYLDHAGNRVDGAPKGSVVTYLPPNDSPLHLRRFAREFSPIGAVLLPASTTFPEITIGEKQ